MTIPSVGRVVHYVAGQYMPCVAAVVSEVQDEAVLTLTTFPATGPNVLAGVQYDGRDKPSDCTWHWPERV